MTRDILIATHNLDKLKELQELLNPFKFHLHFLQELPDFSPSEEDQETLLKNAMKKALEAAKYSGMLTLADDTGLFITALAERFLDKHLLQKIKNVLKRL